MLTHGNRCGHTNHHTEIVSFNSNRVMCVPEFVLMGWNPLHRRQEICDPGFLAEKRKPKPVKVQEKDN